MGGIAVRTAEPSDYDRMLPRLFFVHFRQTAFVAEEDGELAGFLVGFLSQTHSDEAYIHFAGVAASPDCSTSASSPPRASTGARSSAA